MKSSVVAVTLFVLLLAARSAQASPSTHVWIPSVDIQPFGVLHIGVDNYFRGERNADEGHDPNLLDIGLTIGVLPFEQLQLEIGADYVTMAADPNDRRPWSGNAKLGTPEGSLFGFSPALAVGIYNGWSSRAFDESGASAARSGQNIAYGLLAKTIPGPGPISSLGRFSGGYYHGSKKALLPDNSGLLLSWDRTMKEISEKLWVAVDYMGGDNVNGALSYGLAWRFNRNASLLFGYDKFPNSDLSGEDTFTLQLDIDYP